MVEKNRYSGLIEGLTKGLYGVGSGLIEHSQRKDAKETFNSITDDYAKYNTLKNNAIDVINNEGAKLTLDETRANNIENSDQPKELPLVDKTPVDKSLLLQNLYKGIATKTGELGNNPYGKGYLDVIEKLYGKKQNNLHTEFDKESNMMVTFDEYGNIVRKQKYLDEPPKTLPKKYTQEEIDKMTLADVEKMNTDDIDKIFNFLPISVQNEWSAKHTQPEETTGFKGSSRRSGFRGSGTTPLSNIRQSNYDSDLKGYNKAVEENDQETMNFYKNKFLEKGLDINQKYEEYKNLDPKKKRQFLADTERQEQQINTSYNEVYQHLNMDNWWKDLDSSIDVNDLSNKVAYYEDYLNKEVFPNVPKEIGAKLWSELQKAKAKIYNYKGFANQ